VGYNGGVYTVHTVHSIDPPACQVVIYRKYCEFPQKKPIRFSHDPIDMSPL